MKKKIQWLSCIVFCGFIGYFFVANMVNPDKSFSENENRVLTKKPEFSLEALFKDNYTTDLENYITDQFIYRDTWISIKALSKIATGSIENNTVYFGHRNQLIQQFVQTDTSNTRKAVNQINQFVETLNIPFDLMIVPTASESNHEGLPRFAYNENQKDVMAYIQSKTKANWIDVQAHLTNTEDTYFKTDHHWNEKGAYAGYQAYLNAMDENGEEFTYEVVRDGFKGTLYSKSGAFWHIGDPIYKMIPKNKIQSMVHYEDGLSLNSLFSDKRLEEKDKYTYYLDGNHSIVKIENEGVKKSLGNLLVIKDSYGHILAPYLASHYDKIIMVDLRYYRVPLTDLIETEGITRVLMVYNVENFMTDKNFTFLK